MASKPRIVFSCRDCGAQSPKWVGQCADCGAWNSLEESRFEPSRRKATRFDGFAPARGAQALSQLAVTEQARQATGLAELDRVLGGGLVAGSVILIGGDPGIGKSTLVLQCLARLSGERSVLYASGEESMEQIALRAQRLEVDGSAMVVLAETAVETILAEAAKRKPAVIVADSIQTLYTEQLQSAPGSVAQVRDTAAQLVRFAKQTGAIMILIGHVTKEGALAGPRVLEHMVDTVLYFEGDRSSRYRLLRAIKNRFGAVNEIGVFAMTDRGLKEVNNPSAMFMSQHAQPTPGSVILASQEGTRPLLVEIQALVDQSPLANPRRLTVGLDSSRLAMLLAILHRHCGLSLFDQDVFVNAVGGVRVIEPAADLAVCLAAVSSLKNRPVIEGTVVFGEVGLAGEVRPVQWGPERLREAAKLGFTRAVIPAANRSKQTPDGIEVVAVTRVEQALAAAMGD